MPTTLVRFFAVFLVTGFHLAASTLPGLAQPVPVPGTQVSIVPPPGFVPSEQFPGYREDGGKASVIVSEMPAPIDKIVAGLTADGLASRGMTLLTTDKVEISGQAATLLHVEQSAGDVTVRKWMAAFGDASRSLLIMATFPADAAPSLAADLKQAVLSVLWEPNRQVGPFDGLPFRVTETESLKVSNRMANMVLLTKDGSDLPVAAEEPLAVVGTSISEVQIEDLVGYSRARIMQTAQVTSVANLRGQDLTVGGLRAYELVADALDERSGTPITLYQVIAVDGQRYFLVQGLVGASKATRYLEDFRALSASLTLVP